MCVRRRMLVGLGALAFLTACNASGLDKVPSPSSSTTATEASRILPGSTSGDIKVVSSLPPPKDAGDGGSQKIAFNDILEIDVFQVDELDRKVQVDAKGMISLPLVGDVKAHGLTTRQLETELKKRYSGRYLVKPQITVFLAESFGQRVTVDGQVRKAGILPVSASTTLLGLVAQTGGLTEIADPKKIYVFRDHGNQRLVANYDLSKIRSGKSPDLRIYGGDVVVVFSSSSKIAMRSLREALGIARGATGLMPL